MDKQVRLVSAIGALLFGASFAGYGLAQRATTAVATTVAERRSLPTSVVSQLSGEPASLLTVGLFKLEARLASSGRVVAIANGQITVSGDKEVTPPSDEACQALLDELRREGGVVKAAGNPATPATSSTYSWYFVQAGQGSTSAGLAKMQEIDRQIMVSGEVADRRGLSSVKCSGPLIPSGYRCR